jgi:hypothetical protein
LQSGTVNTATVAGFIIFFVSDCVPYFSAMNAEIGVSRPQKAALHGFQSALLADFEALMIPVNHA